MESIENVLDYLINNPIYAAVLVLLLVLMAVALIKKMTKLLIIALIAAAAYGYYLHDVSRGPLDRAKDQLQTLGEDAERLMERSGIR